MMISVDYSQLELRILAHFCGEGLLFDAFVNGDDVHERTRSVLQDAVGGGLFSEKAITRDIAKAINYGLIYGMGANKLARSLGLTRAEAETLLTDYFSLNQEVDQVLKAFVNPQSPAEQPDQDMYTHLRPILDGKEVIVKTVSGRKRRIKGFFGGRSAKAQAERYAMNTPIQGTAADIIKIAMNRVADGLDAGEVTGELLLQIHDELLLEVPDDKAEETATWVKEQMERALELRVPLIANVSIGESWGKIH